MKRRQRTADKPPAKKAKTGGDVSYLWTAVGKPVGGTDPLLVRGSSITAKERVAGFDIDFTIIKTRSGRRFATGPTDWEFLYDCVPAKLKELHDDGVKIAFFTNQAGIEKGRVTVSVLQEKIEAIISELGIPVQVFVSTGENHFRKPSVCMWKYMEDKCNGGVKVDRSKSMYIGDAAGRLAGWKVGVKKDFSASDRMFAANLNVEFKTPEEFFLGEPTCTSFTWGSKSPTDILQEGGGRALPANLVSKSQEVVVLVGRPASGKSTLTKRKFEPAGYVRVNQDTLKTLSKCVAVAQQSLEDGKSVVIDNTNRSSEIRAEYIQLAKAAKVPARCFYLDVSQEITDHLNYYRQNKSEGMQRRIPDVAYRTYDKSFQAPTKEEGFSEVTTIKFVPHFDKKADEVLFKQWQT